jgi:hypothetical protein
VRVAFLLSNLGGSPLTIGLERGMRLLGHQVVDYTPDGNWDLLLVFNQCAHVTNYAYPPLPPKNHGRRIAFIDTAEYGWTKRVKEPIGTYWNAFAEGSMTHDTKNPEQQTLLRDWLDCQSFPYFVREFWNAWAFPAAYHPIDYPLYQPSAHRRAPKRDEYLRRTTQVACLWGLSNPWRVNLTAEMEASPVVKDVYVIERDGPRLPQFGPRGYFERLEAARCSVSFDGYGSGSFRMTEVLCRTLLMQGPLAIKTHAPLIHGDTCWAYCVWVDGEHYVRSDLVEQIQAAMADPERCFEIHHRGFNHCMAHLTERATAEYVLRVIDAHDLNQVTRIY